MGGPLTSGRRWRPALTLWLPVEAARALYLPALAASGGGNGGRLASGRRWRPALTLWPPLEANLPLWLPVEAARALYLPALAASGGGNGRPTDIWPPLEAGPHALAASGGSQSTLLTCSGRQWRRQWAAH